MEVGTTAAGDGMVSAHYSTFSPKAEARRGRMGVLAAAVTVTLVALVGVAALVSHGGPTELSIAVPHRHVTELARYMTVRDSDGNFGVQHATSGQPAAQQQSLAQEKGPLRAVNKCNLYGCHTVRVQMDEKTQLEAAHEERLRAMKAEQSAKLMAQRQAMEASLAPQHHQQQLAMARAAPAAQAAAAAITKAFAKVDSENPQQAPALAAVAEEKAAASETRALQATKKAKSQKPRDTLQAETNKATDESAAENQTVQHEVVAIRAQAVAAEKKIQTQERAEVEAIKSSGKKAAPVTAPAAATTKKVALPQQAGPKAAKFAMPASSDSPENQSTHSSPVIASAASTSKNATVFAQQDASKAAKFEAAKSPAEPASTAVEKKVHVKKAVAAKRSKKAPQVHKAQKAHTAKILRNDVAARRPKVQNMKDGDQKPRGAAPAAVQGGYWKQSVPSPVVKSLKVAANVNTLSQMPAKDAPSRRAQGRAAMRVDGTHVAPNFSDKTVAVAQTTAPYEEFAGQVCCSPPVRTLPCLVSLFPSVILLFLNLPPSA